MPSLKSKDIPVPFRRFLDVADGQCYVINAFELHEQREILNSLFAAIGWPIPQRGRGLADQNL